MSDETKPSLRTVRGGKAEPEHHLHDHSQRRSLEAEMQVARSALRESLGRAPTSEEVRQEALAIAAESYGEQSRAKNDTARQNAPPGGDDDDQ